MKKAIISQYKASFNMLKDTINKCPESLWDSDEYENPYWHIVYHTIFFAALYLSRTHAEFIPWEKHRTNYNFLGSVTPRGEHFTIEGGYSKDELIEYLESIYDCCESSVNNISADDQSGFEWLPINKLELQFYNIRHIQHHTGQLIERLHQNGIKGIRWERTG